jgi:hypothetical protein
MFAPLPLRKHFGRMPEHVVGHSFCPKDKRQRAGRKKKNQKPIEMM